MTLQDQRDTFIQCRIWGHSWDPIPPPANKNYGAAEHLRCTRCNTIRFGRFSPFTGERITGLVYVYPDGYLEVDTYTRNEWRKEGNKRDFFQPSKTRTERKRRT